MLTCPRIDERFRFADIYMDLEHDVAGFLGTEAAFSTIPFVISLLAKRRESFSLTTISICYSDRLANFCSTFRWFGRNDLRTLKDVLLSVEKE